MSRLSHYKAPREVICDVQKSKAQTTSRLNMTRIVGVTLPDDSRIHYALTLLYGIGFPASETILKQASVEKVKKVKDLSEEEKKRIQEIIEKEFQVEGDLKEQLNNNIKRLKEIGSYRGLRHIHALPVRGQRTRSNARTKRGKRKTVGALKKEDMVKMQQQPAKKS